MTLIIPVSFSNNFIWKEVIINGRGKIIIRLSEYILLVYVTTKKVKRINEVIK